MSLQFKASIKKWAKQFPEHVDALSRQVCQEMALKVVEATPVDTGFLRGSWQPSIGEPASVKGELDPTGAMAAGKVGLIISGIQAGDQFFMTNNAAYGPFVEYGTSVMAGRFFVTATVKQWKQVVDKTVKELKL